MRDFDIPPADIEDAARRLDPDAWCSSDSEAEAYDFRNRRYKAREAAGWPNERWCKYEIRSGQTSSRAKTTFWIVDQDSPRWPDGPYITREEAATALKEREEA